MIPPNMVPHQFHTFKIHIALFTFVYMIIMHSLKMAHQTFQCTKFFSTKSAGTFL